MFAALALRQICRPAAARPILTRSFASLSNDVPVRHGRPFAVPKTIAEPPSLPGLLRLQTGETFSATSFGAPLADTSGPTSGEIVFTTALVGYPESMTDPSYKGQILVFTQPLVGNYGVPAQTRDPLGLLRHFESEGIQCQGIVVSDYAQKYSHWNAVESLGQWCARHGVPALTGVDTRAVVTLLRDRGSTLAEIHVGEGMVGSTLTSKKDMTIPDPNLRNLVAEASTRTIKTYNPTAPLRIALLDCGAKHNLIRCLASRGASVVVLPWDHDLANDPTRYDGIFLSNGPGNPQAAASTAARLGAYMTTRPCALTTPILGVCMGNQLLGLAAGYRSYKLKYGNRGHNQPALDLDTGSCVVTSQNHGYALADDAARGDEVPEGWRTWFRNANDGSNEGIRHETRPWRAVQFHPEAMGGPRDTDYLFDEFVEDVRRCKAARDAVSAVNEVVVPDDVVRRQASPSASTSTSAPGSIRA
ncbi:Multifunctional pyrimidine synthesis protein CAD [Thoreauomyces humboldtii]|nr:Multifunctional pyrimidine synthesis protein CAD [Thoreauomyces humboldtii]